MAAFDGTSCLEEHLMAYKNLMLLYTTNPALWCKFFPTTLTGVALTWYTSLPGRSIHTFAQLESKFLGHFVASRRQEKSNFHLLSITQLEGESISSYLRKFHEAVLEAHDPKRRKSEKKDPISNRSSRSVEEHPSRRDKNYMPHRPEPPSDMGPPRSRHVYAVEGESRTRNLLDGGNDPRFNWNRKDIFFAVRYELPTPPPITTPSDRRNYNLWFINRKDYGTRGDAERRPWNQKRNEARRESSNTQGTINMIFSGYTEEYPTIRAAKGSVHTLFKGPPKTTSSGPIMRFDATTSQPLQQPHTDPLVVTIKIGQMMVRRVLVDTGSTADLITMECLRKMKFEEKHLQPLDKLLIGFGGNQVIPMGTIILPVRVGERSGSRTMPIRFTSRCHLYSVLSALIPRHARVVICILSDHQNSFITSEVLFSDYPALIFSWCKNSKYGRIPIFPYDRRHGPLCPFRVMEEQGV
ncbi:uncharacterized protein LOC130810682 [Amaranthus tricolor]|uniref:uncharacterized protein LOC130810682 n=1 Tax=Amaranthus tricolor TaxID=29722 RepID=UPI002583CBE3|nr:uncharacterized protein LOC130810682 [Amaranthus tricolor]